MLFENVPLLPEDPIYGMIADYNKDTSPKKVNVGVGAYRTNEGKPWVLPVVKKAEKLIIEDGSLNHEYLPIAGTPEFTEASAKLILGEASPAIQEGRYCAIQSISGTGSLRLCAAFLARFMPSATVYLTDPTWINHKTIFKDAGLEFASFPYWDPVNRGVDIDAMCSAIESAPAGSIFVLHACAHNPTGNDPTLEQWKRIAGLIKSKGHMTVFDSAYQGFASGDLDRDAQAVRLFVDLGLEMFIAQSYAKNFGLYNERAGALVCVASSPQWAQHVRSNLCALQRGMVSSPPAFGSRIVTRVLTNPELYAEWRQNLSTMVERIHGMRQQLYERLTQVHKTPGSWEHVITQIGMFSYTGLNGQQSRTMRDKFHIYMTENGRISIAGLTTENIGYFAESMDWVVRNVQ